MTEVDKEWVHEKCGTNTPPKEAPKQRSLGNVLRAPRLKSVKDYDSYINSLKEEAEALHIRILDMSCDLSSIKRKMEVAISERNKKAAKKAQKVTKEAGNKS